MSTATSVPETYELEGDDAIQTLRNTGWGQLAKDSFVRFRAADGTSHSRSLAFQVMLALLPFVIAVVGLTTVLNIDQFRQLLTQTVDRLAPGPAGQIFTQAISQGAKSAARAASGPCCWARWPPWPRPRWQWARSSGVPTASTASSRTAPPPRST